MDFFAQVANNGDSPRVTSVCGSLADDEEDESGDEEDEDEDRTCGVVDWEKAQSAEDVGWAEVRRALSRAKRIEIAEPLPSPPRILPTSCPSELRPLLRLLRTVVFAATKHRHQTRKDPQRTPYINHPLAVARILAEVGIRDLVTLQVALLHDTLEDTATTEAELRVAFGSEVTELVESLTDDDSLRPMTRKLKQLRGARALRYKAKLVRIADKLHNVWDIHNHSIPGWTKERTERYMAWACELVTALQGAHTGLERRFFSEISLPADYELGDWERTAAEEVDEWAWEPLSGLPRGLPADDDCASDEVLAEHRAVYSLLLAAEFLAQQQHNGQAGGAAGGEGLLRALNIAVVLAQHGVRDSETLQAALVRGALHFGGAAATRASDQAASVAVAVPVEKVRKRFGEEVGAIVGRLSEAEGRRLCAKAKVILLAEMFWDLREMQVKGLADESATVAFCDFARQALEVRNSLKGTHPGLEADLDEVFGGQVRLASGELVPVAEALKLTPELVV